MEVLGRGIHRPLEEEPFNELALRIFRFQCQVNQPYAAFVSRRGVEAFGVDDWRSIPPLPARAFKVATLLAGGLEEVEAVFRTSGTTRGSGARGEHYVRDLSLYRAGLLHNFQAHVLAGTTDRIPILCLLPSPQDVPDCPSHLIDAECLNPADIENAGAFNF